MRAEEPIEDDPVIRRVAAARPVVPEDDLSPTGARAVTIAERVLAESGQTSSRRWSRPRWTLPWVGLAVAAAAAIVLVLAGTLSGPDTSGTQPAAAAVIHATLRALAQPPGLIAVDDETYVSGPGIHGHPYTIDEVQETPSGSGAQNALTTTDDPGALLTSHRPALSGFLYLGGEEEVYSPTTDTIYESSIWGPYLHRGRRPGTFFYRDALGAPTYATRPVSLTARQVRELLDGAATLGVTSPTSGVTTMPPGQAPDEAQTIHEALASHALHFVARTTVDGRAAFELAGRAFAAGDRQVHVYVDPTTHLPFEEVDGIGTRNEVVIRMALRMLPITRSSERLLSLQVLHPGARIDRNHRDYLRAVGDVTVFPG